MALGRNADADIPALARDYHRQLESHDATRRVVLAGWSMGALIAHEMAVLAAEEDLCGALGAARSARAGSAAPPLGYDARVAQYLEKVEIFAGRRIGEHRTADGGLDLQRACSTSAHSTSGPGAGMTAGYWRARVLAGLANVCLGSSVSSGERAALPLLPKHTFASPPRTRALQYPAGLTSRLRP